MGRFPRNSILAATHSVEFAQRWGGGHATTLRSNPMCSASRSLPTLPVRRVTAADGLMSYLR